MFYVANRKRVQLTGFEPTLTQQHFKDQCDIVNIMNQYSKTGVVSHVNSAQELLGDYTDIPDYQSALNTVIEAQSAFDQLPSKIRKRFNNNPAEFLDFVHDQNNYDEMVSLGMIEKKVEQSLDNKGTNAAEGGAGPSST